LKQQIGDINIKKGTNKVIPTTYTDWSNLRKDSYFRLKKNIESYKIIEAKEESHTVKFSSATLNKICIPRDLNSEHMFLPTDLIEIKVSDYEVVTVIKIEQAGSGYKVNDILEIAGGTPKINLMDETEQIASFVVKAVTPTGKIKKLDIITRGQYILPPRERNEVKGGMGNGAIFHIYVGRNSSIVAKRNIQFIVKEPSALYFTLDTAIPNKYEGGEIILKKWILILEKDFQEEDAIGEEYDITSDCSPNLKLLFLGQNSPISDIIFNENMNILDARIAEINSKLDKIANS